MSTANNTDSSRLALHAGEALMVVASTYPRLLDFILEIIQNSLDAKAKLITVRVNLERRAVEVSDDGLGVSRDKFEQAMTQVCRTMKSTSDLGRFGRGMVSPLGKCRSFTLTSCPRAATAQTTGYVRWTFVTDDFKACKENIDIPCESLPRMMFCRRAKKPRHDVNFVPWRTQVKVMGIITDRFLTKLSLDELADNILNHYSVRMRKQGTIVSISFTDEQGKVATREVRPEDYTGRPLPNFEFTGSDSGKVRFQLFIAPATVKGRKGKVVFGETRNDFRISGQAMWHSLLTLVPDETIGALRSGIFEGEILGQHIEFDPDRKRFLKNDAFIDLCSAIEEWYQKIGKEYVSEIVAESKEHRYQEIGTRAMRVVSELLRQPQFHDLLGMFRVGSIGSGHYDLPDIGRQPVKSISSQGKPTNGIRVVINHGAGSPSEPSTEYPDHHPGTVAGPDGQFRRQVRSSSTGLQFRRVDMLAHADPWQFDYKTGVIAINTSHLHWFDCERTDTMLMRYHEVIAIQALTSLRTVNTDMHETVMAALYDQLSMMVFHICQADVLSGRRAGSKQSGKSGK